jgi:hypothetical protein
VKKANSMKKRDPEPSMKPKPFKLEVKCTLKEEPARIVLELKERGVVASIREAVVHGLMAFHEKIVERDLKIAQLKASKRLDEEL